MIEVFILGSAVFQETPLCDLIRRSKLLELAQGFGLVTPDPFSRELGGVWARDLEKAWYLFSRE